MRGGWKYRISRVAQISKLNWIGGWKDFLWGPIEFADDNIIFEASSFSLNHSEIWIEIVSHTNNFSATKKKKYSDREWMREKSRTFKNGCARTEQFFFFDGLSEKYEIHNL